MARLEAPAGTISRPLNSPLARFASASLAKTGFEFDERQLIERDIAEAEAEMDLLVKVRLWPAWK